MTDKPTLGPTSGGRCLRISLVTPNLNYGQHIGITLKSVVSQDYPNLDYVVVDGGSTDESLETIQRFNSKGVKLFVERGLGQYDAINFGFEKAIGDIMGWINSDDVYLPWTLQTVADIFTQFPHIQWIMGAPAVLQNGAIHKVSTVKPFHREALALGLYQGGHTFGIVQQESCFWRRSLWEQAGPLRPEIGMAADFEIWSRFAKFSDLVACEVLLGGFTIHDSNRSIRGSAEYRRSIDEVVCRMHPSDIAERH